MKKVLPLLALGAVVASASVQAEGNWYIGADILNSDIKSDFHSKKDSATGLSLSVGKERVYSQNLTLAFEGEFIHFGSFDYNGYVNDGYGSYPAKLEVESYAVNLNMKPKYYFSGTGIYVGAIAGFGVMGVDLNRKVPSNPTLSAADDGSSIGFNYGVEAGYEFASGLIVSGGYRASSVTIDVEGGGDIDFDFDSLYAGIDYKF
ncbi:outer membrane beta-barrel protein [Vibrio campbellii]|uniref:outer membrane beta-barrel protein n=1 Tax=Vibrio campbellii TaxID=680 RepID=UPI000CD35ED0|nr:outer membrane beta-barrel protein [Vibrio campbellii]AUV85341.1 hypothetical protein C1N50_03770 [Vibrio campbellii]